MSKNEKPNPFKFHKFADCIDEAGAKPWILENVIALDEDSSWFGPPGSLKSALLTDIAVSVASGQDWRGNKFGVCCNDKEDSPRGVIYFALERVELTKRRLAAYAFRDKLPSDLPITIISEMVDLLDPTCVKRVQDTIDEFERETDIDVALIIIDTYSKAIASGDEDKAQTQNTAAKHLRLMHEGHGIHIATIGHTGKNASAGERGSNARLGHIDLAVQISGDKVRTATIVKANDQPEGLLTSFEVEEVTVTRPPFTFNTRSGPKTIPLDPYTVAILAADTPTGEARTDVSKLSLKEAKAFDALKRAIAARGQDGAVHVDYWKEELTKVGLLKADAKNPWQPFKRIKESLAQRIIEADGIVRLVSQSEIAPPPYPSHPHTSHTLKGGVM